jgi:carboxypeptidase C (cathepsin A)
MGNWQVPSPGDAVDSSPRAAGEPPKLYRNKFAWTKVANLFTIEQPKGVGFSYVHIRQTSRW